MAYPSRILAGLALLALGTSVTACSGSSSNAGPPPALPAGPASRAQRVTPAIKYPLEFVNRTSVTINVAPNGAKCMNSGTGSHTMRPHTRWEPSVNTKGSGSCTFAPSIFYLRFTSGRNNQWLFDIQFEKKVHKEWVTRYSGRASKVIKFCWFTAGTGLAGGLGVLQAENRHCSPS